MVIRRKSSSISFRTQLGVCILAGASTGLLVAVVIPNTTRPVEADARLPKPAALELPATSLSAPMPMAAVSSVAAVQTAVPSQPSIPVQAQPSTAPQGQSPAPAQAPVAKSRPVHKRMTDLLHGIASWYGAVRDGHRTASGERFDMNALTACHPTLPFGTLVKVTDLNTKKSVVVRINDRGTLSTGRVIDLSYAAAKELEITRSGLAPVALEVVSMGMARKQQQQQP